MMSLIAIALAKDLFYTLQWGTALEVNYLQGFYEDLQGFYESI